MNKQKEKACDCSQALRCSDLNQVSLIHIKDKKNAPKDKFQVQLKRVYEAFKTPGTMLEISYRTGIERANICWYVRELEKHDKIQIIRKGFCSITKHRAGFYTTDEALFHNDENQLKLF
ncbi:hypothetical protein [Labilibaculum sp.]|uniref:hypothetical protein n=1 Tax=Labilibaculum sp. TaxID=2060723 RepID=UPI003569A08B